MTSRANKKRLAREEKRMSELLDYLYAVHIKGEKPVQASTGKRKWPKTVWGMNWKPTDKPERLWETRKLDGYYLKHREDGAE